MFTHTILLATESPDDLEHRGPITKTDATRLVAEFPFARECPKRALNSDLMAPTLTFTNEAAGTNIAVWVDQPGVFTVWFPEEVASANVSDMAAVVEIISLFFDQDVARLVDRINQLSSRQWGRLLPPTAAQQGAAADVAPVLVGGGAW